MNDYIIWCNCGFKRTGKDTIGEYLIREHKFKRLSFGDEVKKEVSKQEGISLEEIENNKETYRYLLTSHGEIKRKTVDSLYWVKKSFKENNIDPNNLTQNIVITDVRRLEELTWLKELNEKNNNIYVFEIIKTNHWDDDIETIKSIVYGNYFNIFYGKIINKMETKEKLYKLVENFLKDIYFKRGIKND